jgi:hypothetical protein
MLAGELSINPQPALLALCCKYVQSPHPLGQSFAASCSHTLSVGSSQITIEPDGAVDLSTAPPLHCEQLPAAQTWSAAQAIPHPPQFIGSLAVSTQTPLQSIEPGAHPAGTHTPKSQAIPAPQGLPHPPQFAGSDITSVQTPSHFTPLPEHVGPHIPAEHSSPAPHGLSHAPQLVSSVIKSTHAPPHGDKPGPHAAPPAPPIPPALAVLPESPPLPPSPPSPPKVRVAAAHPI